MKQRFIVFGFFFLVCVSFSNAQKEDNILFRIGDDAISQKEAIEILRTPEDKGESISLDEFNSVLSFYLSIHDFKARKADTTKLFKRKLEGHTLAMLGSIYGAENNDSIIDKCAVYRKTFPVVKDLFVPFDPLLLRNIEKIRVKEGVRLSDLVKYASAFDGVHVSTRIITPTENNWSFNRSVYRMLMNSFSGNVIGPIKDAKGYHYLELIREQKNFGRYKTQMIYISDNDGKGEQKIHDAYELLKSGIDFEIVASQYSEARKHKNDSAITYFVPSVNSNQSIQEQLGKLGRNGVVSQPFYASGAWYIIKRLAKENYPSYSDLEKRALSNARRPSFFITELKEKYNVKEYPHNFLVSRDEILFLIDSKPYYTEDFRSYSQEYGYDYTTDTYDKFFKHILVEKYKGELDSLRYKRLVDDFYFLQIRNPLLKENEILGKERNCPDLQKLIKKYKPVIPNKKYVENNPMFEK